MTNSSDLFQEIDKTTIVGILMKGVEVGCSSCWMKWQLLGCVQTGLYNPYNCNLSVPKGNAYKDRVMITSDQQLRVLVDRNLRQIPLVRSKFIVTL